MAHIQFINTSKKKKKENRIRQGDYVFCKGHDGAHDFWGIFGVEVGVVSLNGAGNSMIKRKELYVGDTHNYWTIEKRIPCENAFVQIKDITE